MQWIPTIIGREFFWELRLSISANYATYYSMWFIFHHVSCTNVHFELQPGSEDMVNTQCSSLKSDEKLSAILERGSQNIEDIHTKTNNNFLTHSQLSEKRNTLRKDRNLLQLKLKNKCKRVAWLNFILVMHKRFMVLLSQNDVLRVKELVAIALKHNRRINYIVDKVLDAIARIYRARPSNDN